MPTTFDSLVAAAEETLFTAADSVCLERARLVTEAYSRNAGLPAAMLRARAFEHLLSNMTLDLSSNPLLAGNTSTAPRAWMLIPEFGLEVDRQIGIEHPDLRGFLDSKIPSDIVAFWSDRGFGGTGGIGHMSLDFNLVVNRGLNHVLETLAEHREEGTEEHRLYREAMAVSCRAVIAWANRYADAAAVAAAAASDPVRAQALRRVAVACRRVPALPARNYFEGLQAITLVHHASILEGQGMSISIGLPDRALAPFADEVGERPDAAITLTRAFLLKIAANSFQGRGSKTQAVTIGGGDVNGDACNAVTRAFLAAFDRSPVSDPHLFLRRHSDLDDEVWTRAMSMLSKGRSMPLLVNDHAVVPGLLEAGVSEADAWDYCIVGCNELGIPGRCAQSGFTLRMGFNDLELMDRAIHSGGAADVPTVLDRYEGLVEGSTRSGVAARQKRIAEHVHERPFPFCSSCFQGCPETGTDLLVGAIYPDIFGLYIRGTSNAVNALAAFEALVGCGVTIDDLWDRRITAEPMVRRTLEAAPKWGNDNPAADRLGVEMNARRDRALRKVAEEEGLPPFAVCHVVRSLHHVDGERIGATLDGRAAGTPVCDSIGPVVGTNDAGPTALLSSVLKLDAKRWFPGIYNLNVTLPAGPQAEAAVIESLAAGFFARGGQELQFNVLDPTKLREARRNPERYRDLVVRVAGLNARFVELSELEQDELIHRAELVAR